MMNTIYQTQPNTATIRWGWLPPNGSSDYNYRYIQFNYSVQGTLAAGVTSDQFAEDLTAILQPVAGALFPSDSGNIVWYMSLNDGVKYRQCAYLLFGGVDPTIFLPMPEGVCIMLYSPQHTRNAVGRLHWPWVRKSDVTGSYIQPSIDGWLNPLTHLLTHDTSLHGIDLQPTIWSRKLDVNYPILRVQPWRMTTWLAKRRITTKLGGNDPLWWPVVW